MSISYDNKYVASGGEGCTIKLIETEMRQVVHTFLNAHGESYIYSANSTLLTYYKLLGTVITHVKFPTKTSRYLISAAENRSIKIWDLLLKAELHCFENAHLGNTTKLSLLTNKPLLSQRELQELTFQTTSLLWYPALLMELLSSGTVSLLKMLTTHRTRKTTSSLLLVIQ